jgi:hypothetical protein
VAESAMAGGAEWQRFALRTRPCAILVALSEDSEQRVTERKQRRVHVLMPEDLDSAIDALVGSRRRSRCIVEAVEGERRRRRQRAAIAEMDGAPERRAEDVSC